MEIAPSTIFTRLEIQPVSSSSRDTKEPNIEEVDESLCMHKHIVCYHKTSYHIDDVMSTNKAHHYPLVYKNKKWEESKFIPFPSTVFKKD
jgi:hypothetical protein